MEVELIKLRLIRKDLNVIVKGVPWHVYWVETFAPGMESWCPEIHSELLRLVHVAYSLVCHVHMAYLMTINRPRNVMWSPFHLVSVPVIVWVKAERVVLSLDLVLAITIDNIHGEWILANAWYDLQVELVPAKWILAATIPEREETCDGSTAVWCLHARHELSIEEFLIR